MTRSFVNGFFLAALALGAASSSYAADVQQGAKLHAKYCMSCHRSMFGGDGSTIYTRKDHRVTSLAALNQQVHRCEQNIGLKLTEAQMADLVEYLNTTYYQFKE